MASENPRPGAKDKMAVEDRFYFGKGRKERFEEIDVVNQLMQLAMKEGMADRMKPEIDRVLGSGSFDKLFKSYKSALISKRIMELKRQGKSTPEAFDLVLGAGSYKKMVGELYGALRAKAVAKNSRPGKPERFELSFNRSEVERAKSELRSLVDVHRRLADKAEGVKAAKHQVVADVLARLINQGPEVLAAIGFRKASYWNARAMELANASSSGYGPILKTLISEAEREYRSH